METKQMIIEDIKKMEYNHEEEKDDDSNLLYKNRLKELVNNISNYEGFEGIQITKEGLERIQQSSKYVMSMLIVEIVEELKQSNRKQIKNSDVDKALDKMLCKASGVDSAISMLKEDIVTLENLRNDSIINKVNKIMNHI